MCGIIISPIWNQTDLCEIPGKVKCLRERQNWSPGTSKLVSWKGLIPRKAGL